MTDRITQYRRTSRGYFCEEFDIHAFSLLELRTRVAYALVMSSKVTFQDAYDSISFVS